MLNYIIYFGKLPTFLEIKILPNKEIFTKAKSLYCNLALISRNQHIFSKCKSSPLGGIKGVISRLP